MVMKKAFREISRLLFLTGIFSVAMGVLEAVVVVYIRMLYYPAGFGFPLKFLSAAMMQTEWIREIATIVMLAAVGILSGKDNFRRFLYFLFSFAVWDITYYAALKIFLNWPASLFDWDVLFLIPVPWLSPVLAPVICSVLMIIMAVSYLYMKEAVNNFKVHPRQWLTTLTGAALVLISFTSDFTTLIIQSGFNLKEDSGFWSAAGGYVPGKFGRLIFITGTVLILLSIIMTLYRFRRK